MSNSHIITENKLISVVTITYNSADEIGACLDAVSIPYDPRIEIVVIDNVSRDNTINVLKEKYGTTKNIKLVFNTENIGFAKGCNQGAKLTSGKYILLLNPDTVAPADQVIALANYLEHHHDVGVVGPKIIDEYGTTQESYGFELTPWRELVGKLMYSKYLEIIPAIKKWKDGQLVRDAVMEVDWIGGACTLIRRDLYESVGGIDPHYFLSHADMIDLGKSIRNKDYKIVLNPKVVIVHAGSKSIGSDRDLSLHNAYVGTLYYFKKYYGSGTVFIVKAIYVTLSLSKAFISGLISLVRKNPYRAIGKAHFINAMRILSGVIK